MKSAAIILHVSFSLTASSQFSFYKDMHPLDIPMKVKNMELIPKLVYILFERWYSVSEFEIGIG